MPQAAPYLASAAASALGASAAEAAVFALVVSAALAQNQRTSAQSRARQLAFDSIRNRNITLRSAIAPRTIALGTVRTSGPLMYGEFVGPNEEYLDEIVAVNHGELSEVLGVYIGDEYIPVSSISSNVPSSGKFGSDTSTLKNFEDSFTMTGGTSVTLSAVPAIGGPMYAVVSTGSGDSTVQLNIPIDSVVGSVVNLGESVTGTLYVGYTSFDGRPPLRVQWALGAASQTSTSWAGISTPKWTSDHRLRGVAYVRTLKLIDHPLYLAGTGTDVSLVVRGPKGVWDPRTSTTLDYTSNPALLAAWFRTLPRADGGMGVPTDWIDWPSVATAANICDELISVKQLDGSGYEDVKRYECHTRLSLDRPRSENLQVILDAMAGDFPFTGGKYRCYAGAFRTATVTITDDDVSAADAITFAPAAGAGQTPPNVVTSQFYDAARAWVLQPAKAVQNDTYIADDGQEEPLEIELPATTDERQANYLMGVALERARPAMAGALAVTGKGANLALLDTVQFNLQGYSALASKTFEVRRRTNQWNGRYPIEVREVKASTYALDADRYVPPPAVAPPSNSILFDVDAPGNLAAAEEVVALPGGTSVNRVRVTWDPHPQAYVRERGQIRVRWRQPGAEWVYEPPVPGSAEETLIGVAPANTAMVVQAQALNGAGGESAWAQADVVEVEDGLVVGTGGIAPGAVSETFKTTGTSAVSVTGTQGTPDSSNTLRNTLICTVAFTAAADGSVEVRFDGNGSFTNNFGATGGCRWSIQPTGGTFDAWRRVNMGVATGASVVFPMATVRTFDVTAGGSYSFSVYAAKLDPADVFDVNNFEMTAVVKYR